MEIPNNFTVNNDVCNAFFAGYGLVSTTATSAATLNFTSTSASVLPCIQYGLPVIDIIATGKALMNTGGTATRCTNVITDWKNYPKTTASTWTS